MRRSGILIPIILLLSACCLHGGEEGEPYTSENVLRSLATRKVTPDFPLEALASVQHAAVAEASISINEKGSVTEVTVLESPHPSLSQSIERALRQWKFDSNAIGGKVSKLTGKITFYCLVEGRTGKVVNPEEVGFVEIDGRLASSHRRK